MTCRYCGRETKGIKLNGKLFCNFCGELIKDPTELLEESYKHAPVNPKSENFKNKVKNAIKESPGVGVTDSKGTIKKHERPRTDNHSFNLVAHEPDPISEPELEAPGDMLIGEESNPSTTAVPDIKSTRETNFSPLPRESQKELRQNAKKKQDILASYLRETSRLAKEKKKPSKKTEKSRKKKSVFARVAVILIITLILAGAGLVYYVNNYVLNTAAIEKKLNEGATFTHKEPRGVPEGYQLSYLSEARDNYILYRYDFRSDRDRYVSMKAEKTDLKTSEEIIGILSPGTDYTRYVYDGLDFWRTEEGKVYVVEDDIIYIFAQSGELFDELLLQFAKETIL